MAAAAPSTSASSAHNSDNLPSVTRDLAFPKSDIQVHLKDHYKAKIYTSGSPVKGELTIVTKRDVRFDSIQIVLIGNTNASFDGMSFPQEITHTFLKMVMPVPESTYPLPKVLETGETYTIPFNFVIPNQLTINACNHKRLSDQLQDHHVLLPPSMGGGWERDDMAPRMARVEYSIKARVLRGTVSTTGPAGAENTTVKKTRIMEATRNIQVLPATPEEPPLNITPKDRLYSMTKSKTLRKSFILSTKLGKITAEAHQPSAAVISSDGNNLVSRPSMRVSLTFDPENPANIASPPQITGVSGKITAHTFFSSGTISDFPNLGDQWNTPYVTDRRGQFFTSVSLPPVSSIPEVSWAQKMRDQRRDSGYGTESSSSPVNSKEKQKSPVYLTSTVDIPISVPTDKKIFVPTFHGCIASRVYTLSLSLNISTPSEKKKKNNGGTRVNLTVPLQIAVEQPSGGGAGASPELPTFEEAQADKHLRPRVLQVMSEEMREEVERGRRNRDGWGTSPPVSAQTTGSSEGSGSDGLPGYGGDVSGQDAQQNAEQDGDRLPGYGEVHGAGRWRRVAAEAC